MADALGRAEEAERQAEEKLRHLEEEKAWVADVDRNRQAFLDRLKERVLHQVMEISEKVLLDLANQELNRQVLQIFLEKVTADAKPGKKLSSKTDVVVQTGIPFEPDDQKRLLERLDRLFHGDTRIRIESAPQLGFGIQLQTGDHRTAWHLSDYLQGLEAEIMDKLFQDLK